MPTQCPLDCNWNWSTYTCEEITTTPTPIQASILFLEYVQKTLNFVHSAEIVVFLCKIPAIIVYVRMELLSYLPIVQRIMQRNVQVVI